MLAANEKKSFLCARPVLSEKKNMKRESSRDGSSEVREERRGPWGEVSSSLTWDRGSPRPFCSSGKKKSPQEGQGRDSSSASQRKKKHALVPERTERRSFFKKEKEKHLEEGVRHSRNRKRGKRLGK